MYTIEVIIRNEQGEEVLAQIKRLELSEGGFESIEQAIERWKQETLPEWAAMMLKKNKRHLFQRAKNGSKMGDGRFS